MWYLCRRSRSPSNQASAATCPVQRSTFRSLAFWQVQTRHHHCRWTQHKRCTSRSHSVNKCQLSVSADGCGCPVGCSTLSLSNATMICAANQTLAMQADTDTGCCGWNRVAPGPPRLRWRGCTTRVSVSSGGTQGNSQSTASSISVNGRYAAFTSYADNLAAGDTNAASELRSTRPSKLFSSGRTALSGRRIVCMWLFSPANGPPTHHPPATERRL
jgi:hypothetical protein